MYALCIANAAHFYSLCSIFSYAGFLAVDCGWAAHEDEAGFAAGLLPTAVLLGRLITSIPWGHAADRFGRRKCMLSSLVAITAGNLGFGFSCSNLATSLLVRFILLGAGNGWVCLMGMCTLEVSGEAFQAQAFAYIISTGSVVATLGPALGGWTYGMLGESFPALPPSLVGSAIGVVALLTNYMWLPETMPRAKTAEATISGEVMERAQPTQAEDGGLSGKAPIPSLSASGTATPAPARNGGLWASVCERPLPLVMLLRSLHGMVMFAVFDVVPLWAIASLRAGGLALRKEEVGTLLGSAALLQTCFTVLVMGRLVRACGLFWGLTAGCAVSSVFTLSIPLLPTTKSDDSWRRAAGVSLAYALMTSALLTAGTRRKSAVHARDARERRSKAARRIAHARTLISVASAPRRSLDARPPRCSPAGPSRVAPSCSGAPERS